MHEGEWVCLFVLTHVLCVVHVCMFVSSINPSQIAFLKWNHLLNGTMVTTTAAFT